MAQAPPAITVPEGYTLHTENTAHILLPSSEEVFLNPVQEFNRDLSVACIRVWSEDLNAVKKNKWLVAEERRANKSADGGPHKKRTREDGAKESAAEEVVQTANGAENLPVPTSESSHAPVKEYHSHKVVILEALSATGLRSIRYAKEIPLVKYVIANDLSPSAVEAIKRNVAMNGLQELPTASGDSAGTPSLPPQSATIQVNEGDACALMYNHRTPRSRVDVVDLDPYGTAAPFIDAAVQSVNDGGLLCVTCTDLQVLATTNYPEKCYANYGGIPVKSEWCHEAALRLVLHSISTAAARYGRYIKPLLSLSIDFYVRLFLRVESSPSETKKAASKTSIFYVCSGCQSWHEQPLGRMVERPPQPPLFKVQPGPTVEPKCPECGFVMHLAGPMWSGPLHDTEFVTKVLAHAEENAASYGTATRMKGMLTVAKEELETPFYFTPTKIASLFRCICPSLDEVASALLHGGHKISRSHACPGSLKTTASRTDIHDIFRSWVKTHPVRMDKVSDTSPTHALLQKEPSSEANFTRHPDSVTRSYKVNLVRYQENPTSHWGPKKAAAGGGVKRKREKDEGA